VTTTGAEEVRWDLSPMYAALDDPAIDADLDAAEAEASSISVQLHGKVAELDAPALRDAVERLEQLSERVDKVATFAYLNFATDTSDPARGALLQKVDDRHQGAVLRP
jgi:oligoendopeptidase F